AQALGKIGDRASIPLLLEGLETRAAEAAHGAAYALGALKAKEAVDPMMRLLKSSKDLTLKKHIVAALGEIGDKRAIPSILGLSAGEKLEMADLVGRSLGRLGGEESWKFMERGLTSDDENDKRIARMILTNVREQDKVPRLLKLLENEDVQTRKAAMVSLRRITGKDFGTEREWIDWSSR
ncbi:MAG: HEAT repeat domain-containing protein, partial [Spirochaetia bacterium]|nr:HEAT repeat domain-containing protein [Spirochaetia bacterium]